MGTYNFEIKGIDVNRESYALKGKVVIEESGSFDYGNHKTLTIIGGGCEIPQGFDIRYDREYSEANEPRYVEDFLRKRYSNVSKLVITKDITEESEV
jgi:hypothetical protein